MKAKIATSRVRGLIPLVRVRNPWGNETEWKGTWTDGAEEWGFIKEEEKERLGIYFDHDGEWFMSYKDFVKHYDQLEVCHVSPECEDECENIAASWYVNQWHGEWVGGESAGGCRWDYIKRDHCKKWINSETIWKLLCTTHNSM